MEIGLTRGGPVEWKLWNSAIRFPKPCRDAGLSSTGSQKKPIVAVKISACDDMATYIEDKTGIKGQGG